MVRRAIPWSQEEINFIINNFDKLPITEIQKQMPWRTIAGIQIKYSLLKSQKQKTDRVREWTPEEDNYLLENFGLVSNEELVKKLNRSLRSIRGRFYRLESNPIFKKKREKIDKKIEKIKIEREMKDYYKMLRSIRNNRDYGIGDKIKDLKFKIGQVYVVKIPDEHRERYRVFKGKLIQETDDFIVLENRWRESFLKKDFLIGAYEIKEVSQ